MNCQSGFFGDLLENGYFTCAYPGGVFNPAGVDSQCVFSNRYAGDPCTSDLDCVGEICEQQGCSPVDTVLACDFATWSCLPRAGNYNCTEAGDCAPGTYCMFYPPFTDGLCVPVVPTGELCLQQEDVNPCELGSICYNGSSANAEYGTCVAFFSLLPGETFPIVPGDFGNAAYIGSIFCASGLAVPVANANGYSDKLGRCVAQYNLDGVNQSCANCTWSSNASDVSNPSDLPLYGDGSLVCFPVNDTERACALLPSSVYTVNDTLLEQRQLKCFLDAKGPGGVPCTGTYQGLDLFVNVGGCAYYQCLGIVSQGEQTLLVLINTTAVVETASVAPLRISEPAVVSRFQWRRYLPVLCAFLRLSARNIRELLVLRGPFNGRVGVCFTTARPLRVCAAR